MYADEDEDAGNDAICLKANWYQVVGVVSVEAGVVARKTALYLKIFLCYLIPSDHCYLLV